MKLNKIGGFRIGLSYVMKISNLTWVIYSLLKDKQNPSVRYFDVGDLVAENGHFWYFYEHKVFNWFVFIFCSWKWHVGDLVAENGHFGHNFVKYWTRKSVGVRHGRNSEDSEYIFRF